MMPWMMRMMLRTKTKIMRWVIDAVNERDDAVEDNDAVEDDDARASCTACREQRRSETIAGVN
jgi:hypothetical protein